MASHSYSSSESSSESSYQLILDHIFSYPGTYEIPLRTMYTLNCAPRAQPLRLQHSPSSSTDSSPISQQYGFQDTLANQTFVDNVMAQLQQLSNQPSSLPPSFITSFLRRCFPPELVFVDFPQALTGLDYLRDLEHRRRREVKSALNRLEIDESTTLEDDQLRERYPGVHQWVRSMLDKERKIESIYTQLYVGLRRWILINELSLLPFNKHNCVAMLNSLYPPLVPRTSPTAQLTTTVLQKQRKAFFGYIKAVELNGPSVLENLMLHGGAKFDDNGWPAVTRSLGAYLQLANSIISECSGIVDSDDVSPKKPVGARHRGKVDSGVSLPVSEKRPSTSSSTASDQAPVERPTDLARPVDMARLADMTRPKTPSGKTGSAFEKLARGLKSIGMSRVEVTEILPEQERQPSPTKSKSLRKMRSLGNIGERRSPNSASPLDRNAPHFDADVMRRERQKFEANSITQQKFGAAISHEI